MAAKPARWAYAARYRQVGVKVVYLGAIRGTEAVLGVKRGRVKRIGQSVLLHLPHVASSRLYHPSFIVTRITIYRLQLALVARRQSSKCRVNEQKTEVTRLELQLERV